MTTASRRVRFPAARLALLPCTFTLLFAAPAPAQDQIKLNSKQLSDRVLLTWACDYFQGTNMAVVVTQEGLVIIDTGLSPSTVRRQRDLVERELGRSDFRYLINTHMHNDHAFADEVFPEATVVGHGKAVAALQREVDLIPELIERLRRGGERYGEWAAATSPDSAEGVQAREGVAAFGVGIADLVAYRPVAYLRLAQINERQGKSAEALDYYRLFVDLWKDADPMLQPRVQAAQRAIEALSGDGDV